MAHLPRSMIRSTTRQEAVERALLMCGPAGARIVYRLKDHSGGMDPFAPDPASHWRTRIVHTAVASCDCAGFVAWCLGYPRLLRDFPLYGGWVNCDSAIYDARGPKFLFEEVDSPQSGDAIVYPSIDLDHDGARDRVGHIGLITEVFGNWTPGAFDKMKVAHCSASNQRLRGRAIAETNGMAWYPARTFRGRTDARWSATFLRYRLMEQR